MPIQQPSLHTAHATVAAGLAKIAMVLRHEAWQDAGSQGLTPLQAQILAFLGSHPREDHGVRQIADQLAIAMGTASDSVSALERKGLVKKKPSHADGRAVVLRLTPRGRRQAARSIEWPDVMLEAVGELSPVEQAVFKRGLVKIIHSLQEQGKIPVSRMCVDCQFFRPNAHPDSNTPHHCVYIDAAIGDIDLRLDCHEMEQAKDTVRPQLWQAFVNGHALVTPGLAVQGRE